jgi:ABC-type taurine transport system ATPase subunit
MALIELIDISKSFDKELVLDEFDLSIKENEFITLLGPSGCGKTTTLRILGGFETPDTGKVMFKGEDITSLAPNKRHINTVFQKYALFPNMNIAENIAFGLKISGKSKDYIKDKVEYALKLVNLSGYEKRKVDSLSGGQQQRIAIAVGPELLDLLHIAARRALVPELLTATAPKPRGTGLERQPHRFLVHPSNHKHLAGVILLNNTRNQSFGVVFKIRWSSNFSHFNSPI